MVYTSALTLTENAIVNFMQVASSIELAIKHSRLLSPHTQPDLIKKYEIRPRLGNHRVFIPKSISSLPPEKQPKLPVIVSLHGSAWIVGNPSDDDALNRYVADHSNCVVVGLNYGKAPQRPFPAGLEDVTVLITAVLQDTSLPIDPTRFVLCGGSAGANLGLVAATHPTLKGKFRAIISLCPPVDMVTPLEEKMAKRRRPHVPDVLEHYYTSIRTVYLDKGCDSTPLSDLRLSPFYFTDRSIYPKDMFLLGFEDDVLCWEAEMMADKLAGGAEKVKNERGWKADGIVWEMIPEQRHGFVPLPGETKADKQKKEAEVQALYGRLADYVNSLFPDNKPSA